MENFKPTNEKPLGPGGKKLDKNMDTQLKRGGVNLTEIDKTLNEKQQSFKKQHWDLSKMESLVFSDPILSSQYDNMSDRGEEKYGYHYNETIMNMLFNKYVTNDAGYQQKYLNAIPAKKERRDKSGINKLQQKGEEKMEREKQIPNKDITSNNEANIHNNSLEGVIEEDMTNNLNTDGGGTFDDREYLNQRINKKYDITPNASEDISKQHVRNVNQEFMNKPIGVANKEALNDPNPLSIDGYDSGNRDYDTMDYTMSSRAKDDVESDSRSKGYMENPFESEIKETTGAASSGAFSPALGQKHNVYEGKEAEEKRSKLYNDALKKFGFSNITYDSELSTEQRKKVSNYIKDNMSESNNISESEDCGCDDCNDCEEQIDETTSTGSGTGAYVGPFHKKGKNHITMKPAWKGGEIIGESYLVNGNLFKEIYNELNEGMNSPNDDSRVPMAEYDMTNDKESMQFNLKRAYEQLNTLVKTMNSNPEQRKAYDQIKQTAQGIAKKLGIQFKDPEKGGFFNKVKRGLGIGEGEIDESGFNDVKDGMNSLLTNISRDDKIQYILQKGKNKFGDMKMLRDQDDDVIDRIYQQVEKDQHAINPIGEGNVNEKAKSKSQQQFMGMVHAAQKGELENPSASVEKVANTMKPDDVEDFASTKHKGLPEKVKNEGIISGTDGTIIGDNGTSAIKTMKDIQPSTPSGDMGDSEPFFENDGHFDLESNGRKDDVVIDSENSMKDVGVSHGGLTGFNDQTDGYYPEYKKPEKSGAPQNKDLSKYNDKTQTPGIDEDGHCRRDEIPVPGKLEHEDGSCKKKNNKNSEQANKENKYNVAFRKKQEKEYNKKVNKKSNKKPNKMNTELNKHKEHMKKLKEMVDGSASLSEDKKHPSMVNLDRINKDNAKNFKSDIKQSNSAEIAADQDELTAQEQYEDVPENAYELAEKIEKEKMKEHKFNSFDNEGNSTNDDNKSIPKRNATDDEAEDIMLNRGTGMQDIVYDNKPDERFEKRMEKDMGDQIYDQRQEKMKFRSEAPMYNKDTQPIDDGTKETQFDKNISKFNNPKGVKENHIVAGKFVNDMNKTVFVNFNVNEAPVKLVPEGTKLIVEAMGNTYTQGVNENVDMRNMMDSFDFYINGGKVSKVAKGKQRLTEGEEKNQINEQLEKMKKLWNYKPEGHLSTKNVKKNRGF